MDEILIARRRFRLEIVVVFEVKKFSALSESTSFFFNFVHKHRQFVLSGAVLDLLTLQDGTGMSRNVGKELPPNSA
jgi:hypothetical protein